MPLLVVSPKCPKGSEPIQSKISRECKMIESVAYRIRLTGDWHQQYYTVTRRDNRLKNSAKQSSINMVWQKGQSGNPNGRPPAGGSVVEKFRSNPKAESVIDNVIDVASTLGTDNQHPDAMVAAKIVMERLVPAIRAQAISLDTEGANLGPILLPTRVEVPSES